MASTTNGTTTKDYINKLYDSQIASQKEGLAQTYNESIADLNANKVAAEQQKQKNLTATAVEAQRAQKNYNEVQSAYGLTSGAMAQARLAQDNQLQADMTAIRTAAADQDAAIERQRSLLSQQYASAIREAQANNDADRARALYELAAKEEEILRQKQLAAAYVSAGNNTKENANDGSNLGTGNEPAPKLQGASNGAVAALTQPPAVPTKPISPSVINPGVITVPGVKRKPTMVALG